MKKITIKKSKYKNLSAITLESKKMVCKFIPGMGSKMCSLIYKPKNLEMLIQRKSKKYKVEPYDGVYINGEESGFDEMFPTIDKCYYESYPWEGIKIPDHGEVWAIPWEYKITDQSLVMEVYGVRFPYKFKKEISFINENMIKIDYEVTNLSNFNFDFMWAAHAMFILEEGSEIILPKSVDKVISTWRLGNYGDEFSWPKHRSEDGKIFNLNKVGSVDKKEAKKFFIKGKVKEGWCAIKYAKSKVLLALSFPEEKVPYLAILTNEGGWEDLLNIFLEPCTAVFDRLDTAKLRNEISSVEPKGTFKWHLNISISEDLDSNNYNERLEQLN